LEERASYRRKMAGKRLAKLMQANKTAILGFAEAPEPNRRKEEMQNLFLIAASTVRLIQSLFSPSFLFCIYLKLKKRGKIVFV